MIDERVRVLLYDNGNVEIESSDDDSNNITQHLFFSNEKGYGDLYICKKGMESFYLKKMLSKRKKDIDKQIKKLKKAEESVNKRLFELENIWWI